jgi:hypothetical protein
LAGGRDSFEAFRELADLLVRLTVLADHGGIRLLYLQGAARSKAVIEGWTGASLLPLNDGRFLRFSMSLFLAPHERTTRLKVETSVMQYQVDEDGDRWIFRYDYLRHAAEPHPGAHLQIAGALTETSAVPVRKTLSHVHFPTGRVSLEAVIRLLVEQFGVATNEAPAIWQPVLAETERLFEEHAHRPLSGPR